MSRYDDYVDYLTALDSRREYDLDYVEEQTEMRFRWESDDMVFRNVQVLG